MATFYTNSSAQLDVASASYIQDQKFMTSYSDSPMIHGNLMMYLNEASEICPATSMSNEMMFIPPTGAISDTITHPADGEQNLQGLSLSLSTQLSTAIQPSSFHHFSNHLPSKVDGSFEFNGDGQSFIRFGTQNNLGYNGYQYEQMGIASNIMKSKYLKATQQLLDEVVSVQDALKKNESFKEQNMGNPSESKEKSEPELEINESTSASSKELSQTERQELQNKLDKLLTMLDEADRRYKQYHHQMQVLVSSFDMVAGNGGAKSYTTLARKTISRHFRSLRDAISVQIQNTRKSLGEQDSGQGGVIPRLRHVDLQLRQQRALQQFGMMRHAWRPQRGLPENAVTTLRAWLFEHFLHPYPKDSEKIMLARQIGLTRGQVANWFINARVRLWKPMIEEIYKEEFGDADDLNFKSSPENTPKAPGEKSWPSQDNTMPNHEDYKTDNVYHDITEMSQSRGRESMTVSPHGDGEDKHNLTNHGFYPHDQNSLMSFQVPELGNYGVNDQQVSLALGLSDETSLVQHRFSNSHSLINDFVV